MNTFSTSPQWHRSSGVESGSCVEVAIHGDSVLIRNSINPDSPILKFIATNWQSFLSAVKSGDLEDSKRGQDDQNRILESPGARTDGARLTATPKLASTDGSQNVPTALATPGWDVFISHANEDKATAARPLADALRKLGVSVWLDTFELKIGDSLRGKIDYGLAHSRFGVIILSPAFLNKDWPRYELDGLVTRSLSGEQHILPVWHGITIKEVIKASPPLADKIARSTDKFTIQEIAGEIAEVVRSRPE